MSENSKVILEASNLDFLFRNAAITHDGEYRIYALPVFLHKEATDPLLFELLPTPLLNANKYIESTLIPPSKGGISDGYHTFDELYEHRIVNFMALCKMIWHLKPINTRKVWMSKKHSDDTEWEGWFIMGIGKEPGEQITYHLPMSKWDECYKIAMEILPKAPEFDGHTSADVLERIGKL